MSTRSTASPKRLIESDLPIRAVSAHARREKAIRFGHISTLHLWWARRPLAACRAIACAALWPDPLDQECPRSFLREAAACLSEFAEQVRTVKSLFELCSSHWSIWQRLDLTLDTATPDGRASLREALLAFIADFSNWDSSTEEHFLSTSRRLTLVAHRALTGDQHAGKPLTVDPFAGGGAIPLEAARIGSDVFASDLNPIPVLLNRVALEQAPVIPDLIEHFRRSAGVIRKTAEAAVESLYPREDNQAQPIVYIWARIIRCEGPACGVEVPLIRSPWLANKGKRRVALRLTAHAKQKTIVCEIVNNASAKDVGSGTVRLGAATCPACGWTTPVARVRSQLGSRGGGAHDARLLCVVTASPGEVGRSYRTPTARELAAALAARTALMHATQRRSSDLSFIPDEEISRAELRSIRVPLYGIHRWGDLYAPRQALALAHIADAIGRIECDGATAAVQTLLSCALARMADYNSSIATWASRGEFIRNTFARQALPIAWDFAEAHPFGDATGSWEGAIDWVTRVLEHLVASRIAPGRVSQASATRHPLPDDSVDAVITDPPYYYSVAYANLSDFFYVWHRRALRGRYPGLFADVESPKADECVQSLPHAEVAHLQKSRAFYESCLTTALAEARRVAKPEAICVVVFAHSETEAWEAFLTALLAARWCVTASWPIDTELGSRIISQRQRTLASSVHLVCRPRETSAVGDWRTVFSELPERLHNWMPRLAESGVVGADAIFACLGPALEIFSSYETVEKASGEVVSLREYLEHVWAAVAKEAMTMIFRGADTSGFEEDARLTAMWLWTLTTSTAESADENAEEDSDDEGGETPRASTMSGFPLEYDAARKIAQGLGAHLETLGTLVEVKGDTARLLAVSERSGFLFSSGKAVPAKKKTKSQTQFAFVADSARGGEVDGDDAVSAAPLAPGKSLLDRMHQAMLLFGADRGGALRRFLVDEGVGRDERFWRLAQALSALYPANTDEKRWIDGLLARKKGLGF